MIPRRYVRRGAGDRGRLVATRFAVNAIVVRVSICAPITRSNDASRRERAMTKPPSIAATITVASDVASGSGRPWLTKRSDAISTQRPKMSAVTCRSRSSVFATSRATLPIGQGSIKSVLSRTAAAPSNRSRTPSVGDVAASRIVAHSSPYAAPDSRSA